jgi:hypothetical protein
MTAPPLANPPVVVGLDLSLAATGVAGPLWTQLIESTPDRPETWATRGRRIRAVAGRIIDAALAADPALIVVETPSYASTGGSAHDRAGVWWAVVGRLQTLNRPVAYVAPSQRAKYATGNGRAGKGAVLEQLVRRIPGFDVGGDDNRADAAWLCSMGRDHLGAPLAAMPATHRAVLSKVDWP